MVRGVSRALAELRGIARVGIDLCTGRIPPSEIRAALARRDSRSAHLVRFALVGAISALGFLVLFLVLRPFVGALLSNFVALLLTALGNTAANRRLTFGVRDRTNAGRHHLQGLAVFGLGLGLTSLALVALHQVVDQPARWLEIAILMLANSVVTVLRFLLLRAWIFGQGGPAAGGEVRSAA